MKPTVFSSYILPSESGGGLVRKTHYQKFRTTKQTLYQDNLVRTAAAYPTQHFHLLLYN